MQERKKRRIVIASVLKPVDDTRMFEKLAQSLAAVAELHVIGYPSGAPVAGPSSVSLHPTRSFARISLTRLFMPWRIFRMILALRPETLIVTTHELLVPAALLKLLGVVRSVIYDVQENYARNILYTNAFPILLRPVIATYVRLKELTCSPLIKTFLLAEDGYRNELRFTRGRYVVIENKSRRNVRTRQAGDGEIRLLFSGTLNEGTGVFRAIDLARSLHQVDPRVRLTIAGYCSLKQTYDQLLEETRNLSFVTVFGGDHLLPHTEIIRLIGESDAGIVAYSVTPATRNSRPTKLYEYLAGGLHVIAADHQPGLDFLRQYTDPIVFDPDKPDAHAILTALSGANTTVAGAGVFWENEEKKLLTLFA